MIDIKRIVEDTENAKRALLKRVPEEQLNLEHIVEINNQRKELQTQYDSKRNEQNSYNQQMSQLEKGSEEFLKLVENLKIKSNEVKEIEIKLKKKDQELTSLLEVLPNFPDEDVVGGGKEGNKIIKTMGEKPVFDFEIKDHLELGESLDMFDFETASKMSGANFGMYRGKGAQLEWALINYCIEEHLKDGYEMIMPPHIVNRDSAYTAGQLPKFKDDVYWVNEDQCLIPTSETVLTNMYRDEVLEESELPKKMFAYTPSYRKEAGSYRANERGLIRVHQFNKVEMYQFCTPQQSDEAFEELLNKAERLVEGLGLHYNRVLLAAGDCSEAAAKTVDIEVWMPAIQQYYEVSSISNVRDYQARRGNIKYKPNEGTKLQYMNTLNASGLATSRLMVALVETYQQSDGSIVIPEVLRKYTGFDKIEG
ncbi:serine--tRNA ligase [bacterium]|nr:serine--tRNA ligase [bacterium]